MTNLSFSAYLVVKREQGPQNGLFYRLLKTNWTGIPCLMDPLFSRILYKVKRKMASRVTSPPLNRVWAHGFPLKR